MKFIDHTIVVAQIRQQTLGGALFMDATEAEEAVFAVMQEAAKIIHERCVEAAQEAEARGRSAALAVQHTSCVV